jgi:radical SAM protein with 4Fe4S-binding SPASM domain
VAGNVRQVHVVEIYREAEVFRKVRQTSAFKGRCGRCEFREICGGSRARAYAAYGDYLAEDPACSYQPSKYEREAITLVEEQTL